MPKSMFTKEEFETMKRFFEEHSPVVSKDPVRMRAEIAELDHAMEDQDRAVAEGREELRDVLPALNILAQGRNFLARYVGDPEIQVTTPEEASKVLPAALELKHVALYIPEGDSLRRATQQVLGTTRPDLRCTYYKEMSALLDDLLKGEICGAIGLFLQPEGHPGRLGGIARHDLKNRPTWTREQAQRCALPPFVSFGPGFLLADLLATAVRMQAGECQPPKAEDAEFDLGQHLTQLSAHMFVPPRPIEVMIVDDEEEIVQGMKVVLDAWLNISVSYRMPYSEPERKRPAPDVLLLDESMDQITGTEVANDFMARGYTGIIASITGGQKPEYTPWHFQGKVQVAESWTSALEFVHFMNSLLRQLP